MVGNKHYDYGKRNTSKPFSFVGLLLGLATLLLVISSLGTLEISASQHHLRHGTTSPCSALCEAPNRNRDTEKRTNESAQEQKQEVQSSQSSKHENAVTVEAKTVNVIIRPRVDKLPIYKQVAVFLN